MLATVNVTNNTQEPIFICPYKKFMNWSINDKFDKLSTKYGTQVAANTSANVIIPAIIGDSVRLDASVPNDIYEKICQKVKNKNIKIVVDSTGELLIKTLKHKPYLIKPNQQELEEIFGIKISNQDEALEYAKQLKEKGAQNVIVSMGSDGAVLLDENGYSYKIKALNVKDAINTVGAGDSMVAGFLAGHEMFNNYEKALQLGVAAATATTNTIFLATKKKIEEVYRHSLKT